MSLDDVVVRCARAEDVGSVAPLFDAYRQFYGATSDLPRARRFILARLARGESVIFAAFAGPALVRAHDLAASAADAAIGFAQVYPSFSSVALAPILVLNDLFVAPAWRRSNVARRLVGEVVSYGTRTGAARVSLSTQHGNTAARGLYASLGFVPDAEFTHLDFALARSP